MLVFYYREGCHLCEEMAALLFFRWPEVAEEMQWRDVDTQSQWKADFGLKVPVLLLGDICISEYFLDEEMMQQHFGEPRNPV